VVVHAMNAYSGITGPIPLILNLRDLSASHPGHLLLEKEPSLTHCIGGWMGPRTGLDV
jgi:hypothetical protein